MKVTVPVGRPWIFLRKLDIRPDVNATMKKKHTQIFIHVIAWVIFLSLPTFFKPVRPGEPANDIISDLLYTPRLQNSILLIAIFYFNYYIAIPRLYFRKKYFALLLSFVACLGALLLVSHFMRPPEFRAMPVTLFKLFGPQHNLFMFINVYALSFALSLYRRWRKVREQQLDTEVAFLKAQINPHFLFNTLNSIYSLTLTKSDHAPDAVIRLSSLMRYSVTDAERDEVPLKKELQYIKDYIALQQLRITDNVIIRTTIDVEDDGLHITPFMLTPFVENAFKYGVNPEEDCLIDISITVEERTLKMTVENSKVYVERDVYSVSGVGINNTRKRLKYSYPGKHELKINDEDDRFCVSLQIELL